MSILKTGVYKITNVISGKIYIGSTSVSFKTRWAMHKIHLNLGIHPNKHLQSSWKKHGSQVFKFEIVLICSPSDCIKKEQKILEEYRKKYTLFNIQMIPGRGNLGGKLSEAAKKRISDATKLRMATNPELRKKMIGNFTGRKHTEETKKKMSAAQKKVYRDNPKRVDANKRKRSDATRQKMSIAAKLRCKNGNGLKGRPVGYKHSESTKEKQSIKAKERWKNMSKEQRKEQVSRMQKHRLK